MGHGAQACLLLCVLVTPLAARPLPPNSTSQGTALRAGPPWFQYPDDDDTAKIGAAYRDIGEQPVFFAANPLPRLLRRILLGSVLFTLLFFLHQICSKTVCGRQS